MSSVPLPALRFGAGPLPLLLCTLLCVLLALIPVAGPAQARSGARPGRHSQQRPHRQRQAHKHRRRAPHQRGITRAAFVRKSRQLHSQLSSKQTVIRVQQSRLQGLIQQGIALSEQIHQDELAEQDAAARLSDGQFQLKEIGAKLQQTVLRLAAARRRLAADRANLRLRLRDVYEQGSIGILQVLLNSHNIMDFMNRREYVSRVVQRDLSIVRKVRMDQEEIAAESRALAQAQADQAAQVQVIQFQTDRLQGAILHRSTILQATEQQAESARESLSELETQSSSIEAMLHQLQSTPILTVTGPGGRRVRYRLHWMGRFILPAVGPITSPFGYRYHPILHVYKLHTGVDIGAPWGSPVRAAASGVVVHASWLGAYGNGIIIDHGDGLATLYGHLSRIDVREGEAVGQGQVIGAVGTTGLSTGPHLHFEARKYGTPVPPF